MFSSLLIIFKDTDAKISVNNTNPQLVIDWRKEFRTSIPHLLNYRLAYLGTTFSLYQEDKICKFQLKELVNIMYFEKHIRDDIVEEIFFSRVDLDKKMYLKELYEKI